MQLINQNERAMLIIRMQAYAYENIIGRNQDKADAIADEILGTMTIC